MKLTITDHKTGGDLLLLSDKRNFDRIFYSRDLEKKYFTIAWNRGQKQTVTIDGETHDFMPHTILPLMFNQSFFFEQPADVVAWQFKREFYCIIDHDAEVSCVGFCLVWVINCLSHSMMKAGINCNCCSIYL